jgi:Protein phosphatase 2C
VTVSVFCAPRRFEAPDEFEDAVSPEATPPEPGFPLRVAVADGATTSSFSGSWARQLVRAWAEQKLARESLIDDVSALACRWREEIEKTPLSWFAREKVRLGAHAALLGLELEEGGRWSALSVGDCCLFQVRRNILIEAFPARHPEALDQHPYLIGTEASPALDEVARTVIGYWEPGDTLFLMSDALALWFLESAVAREQTPWRWLARLDASASPRAFEAMLRPLRAEGKLRADDVTLVRINL